MKSACPSCGTSSVWTRLADVTRQRGRVVFNWVCVSCGHTWEDVTERPVPPKASLQKPAKPRRVRSK